MLLALEVSGEVPKQMMFSYKKSRTVSQNFRQSMIGAAHGRLRASTTTQSRTNAVEGQNTQAMKAPESKNTATMELPTCQSAIVQSDTPGKFEISTNQPILEPEPSQVLVRVLAVALNHCDWKMPARVPCPGAVNGADYCGVVVKAGSEAAKSTYIRIGDRVAGAQMASNRRRPWAGAYTNYLRENIDDCWKVPDNLTNEQAAAVGCAASSTAGMALWRSLQLKGTPEDPISSPEYVLVYGGATASGTFATQLLRLSGYKVVTTCSPENFPLVESYGAEKAFDYKSPTCGEDIRAYTHNSLAYALDVITEARTIRHCYAAIGRGGGKYCGFELLPGDLITTMRRTVKAEWVMGLELTGLEIDLPGGYYRKENPELHDWFVDLIKRYASWLEEGRIKTHPIRVMKGGLPKVMEGIYALQRREISGEKLVYPIEQ